MWTTLRIIQKRSPSSPGIPKHPQNDRLLRWSPDEKDRIGELIRALDDNVLRKGGKFCRNHSPTNITITKRSGEYVRHLNSKCMGMKYGAWNQPRRSTNILWVWSWCFRISKFHSSEQDDQNGDPWWSHIPLNFTKHHFFRDVRSAKGARDGRSQNVPLESNWIQLTYRLTSLLLVIDCSDGCTHSISVPRKSWVCTVQYNKCGHVHQHACYLSECAEYVKKV